MTEVRGSGVDIGGAISSAFGKGGGGKGGGSDAANTLRSRARARMVELISEGVIEGLVDGERSIYFDTTPLLNATGEHNFKGVVWQEHRGYPDEPHFNGVTTVETPSNVDVQVKAATGPVTRTIVDENADAVRVIVRLPALLEQDEESGSIKAASVHYRIDVRSYNGTWQTAVDNNIENQKCVAPYQIAHRVPLPYGGSPWDIRVVRVTGDSTNVKLQNDTWFEGYVVLVEGKFTYPNTAAIALEVNAEDLGQSIPKRSFHVKGLRILVPNNYDPIARTYSGIWDGTFKRAYSNNPAWIFYDLLVNDRYGLGEFIDASVIDKWSLYTIAQYCDQQVKTGFKDTNGNHTYEPRFTFNGVINSRDDAYNVLQQISTAWRGMAFWSIGQVFAAADMPSDPVKIIAPANVINGEFNYSGTAMKARHSVCAVKWNDPDDFYRPSVEIVINEPVLKRFGWREKTLQLNGCTSRGLAHRYGKWVLDTEQNETETVEYRASWDNVDVRPGQIVAIADPAKAQVRFGGRLVDYQHTPRTATLDHPFTPTPGETYSLMVVMPDGSIQTRPIQSFDGAKVVVSSIFTQTPVADSMFAITGSDITPRQYRVISVEEEEEGNLFKVTALFHDPNKYARVEENIAFDPLPYSRPQNVAYPPTNLQAREVHYTINGATRSRILLSWSPNPNFLSRYFRVIVTTPRDGVMDLGLTEQNWIELNDIDAGTYVFKVHAIALTGMMSVPAELVFETTGPEGIPLPTVTNLRLSDRPGSNQFVGRHVYLAWDNNFATSSEPTAAGYVRSSAPSPLYSHNVVWIYDADDETLLRTQVVQGDSFVYAFDMNLSDAIAAGKPGARRNLKVTVRAYDRYARQSDPATAVFNNPPPEAIAPEYFVNGANIYFNFPLIADADFAGYIIWWETAPGYDPVTTPAKNDILDRYHVFSGANEADYYFRFAAYDSFGKDQLNISSELHLQTNSSILDTEPPPVPDGLTLETRVEEVEGVARRIVLTATLNVSEADDFAQFDFEIKQNDGNWVSFAGYQNVREWDVMPSQTYYVRARATDKVGNASVYSDIQEIDSPDVPELAHLINSGSTTIEPGKIAIAGATTLADWRTGGDETRINGGAISANTIDGNRLTIGQRNLTVENVQFEHNAGGVTNRVGWTSGSITYLDDDDNFATRNIAAGNVNWSSDILFIYWAKGATSLSATVSVPEAFDSNNLVLATYRGGTNLIANYGRTIIDGGYIKTNSITTGQIAANAIQSNQIIANAIQATHIAVNQINANHIVANSIYAGHIVAGQINAGHIQAGSITADRLNVGSLSAISADLGSVTAGYMQSPDGRFRIWLSLGIIEWFD